MAGHCCSLASDGPGLVQVTLSSRTASGKSLMSWRWSSRFKEESMFLPTITPMFFARRRLLFHQFPWGRWRFSKLLFVVSYLTQSWKFHIIFLLLVTRVFFVQCQSCSFLLNDRRYPPIAESFGWTSWYSCPVTLQWFCSLMSLKSKKCFPLLNFDRAVFWNKRQQNKQWTHWILTTFYLF